MGVFIIYDILHRLPVLKIFYSDQGILTRSFFINDLSHPWSFSLLLLNGHPIFTYFFFATYALLAILFIFGVKPRLIAFLLWVFTISIHDRNWWVLNGGDDILKLYLFLLIFIPSSKNDETKLNYSIWTFAYFFQVFLIYFTTVIFKSSPEWRSDFTATELALGLDNFVSYIGVYLRNFPSLLKTLTIFSIGGEFIFSILLILGFLFFKKSYLIRYICVLWGLSFHSGLILLMTLGDFAFFCLAMWIALLPSQFWSSHLSRLPQKIINSLDSLKSKYSFFDFRTKKNLKIKFKHVASVIGVFYILSIGYWNVKELYEDKAPEIKILTMSTRILHAFQRWSMFAPYPYSHNEWLSIIAKDPNGREKETMDYGYLGGAKEPGYKVQTWNNSLFKKFLSVIAEDEQASQEFAFYHCRRLNKENNKYKSIQIIRYRKKVTLKFEPEADIQSSIEWEQNCF